MRIAGHPAKERKKRRKGFSRFLKSGRILKKIPNLKKAAFPQYLFFCSIGCGPGCASFVSAGGAGGQR
jgi:hypothetical protein